MTDEPEDVDDQARPGIPKIYSLEAAANLLGVQPGWLRNQLSTRRFAGLKRAGRWAMTEPQILAAIDVMTVPARVSERSYPTSLTRGSRLNLERGGRRTIRRRPPVEAAKERPLPPEFKKVEPLPAQVIAALPALSESQRRIMTRVETEGVIDFYGPTARRIVESLAKRGLIEYDAKFVLSEKGGIYRYHFTLRLRQPPELS